MASAERLISGFGEGAGQVNKPNGMAIDTTLERLYVADEANQRVDVYSAEGKFEKAFGWGVLDGESKLEVCTSVCRKGIAGSGKGQFNHPLSVAVDNQLLSPSFHDVYVADYENRRIEKFSPTGEYLGTIGKEGIGEGDISTANGNAFSIGVGPEGTLLVIDTLRVSSSVYKTRLQHFTASETLIPGQQILLEEEATQISLTVLPDGRFYLALGGAGRSIRKFDASGNQLLKIAGSNLSAMALDSSEDLFVGELDPSLAELPPSIVEYDKGGNVVRRFGYGELHSAPDGLVPYATAEGDVYATERSNDRFVQLSFPPPGPVIFPAPCEASAGNIKATLKAKVNPEGQETEYRFQYLTQAQFEAGGFSNPEVQESSPAALPGDFGLHAVSYQATGLVPETHYHCRVLASNAGGKATGQDGGFTTKAPLEFIDIWSSATTATATALDAEINPLGLAAHGYFEYVDQTAFAESGFAGASIAPTPPAETDFGQGEVPIAKSVQISDLQPCDTYHYRLHVEDQFTAFESGEQAVRTLCGSAAPPDNRRYELVSPALKNNAEVAVPGSRGGTVSDVGYSKIQAADPAGNSFTFTSFTSFGEAAGAPAASQYLAKRTAGGWGTENISPRGFLESPLEPSYRGFTPDLAFGSLVVTEPPLTPEAQTGVENLYLRDNSTGKLQAVTTEQPSLLTGQEFCTRFSGASSDGSKVFFGAQGAMAGAPKGNGHSLYEWSAVGGLKVVSVLAGVKKPATPTPRTSFGLAQSECGMEGNLAHAVSEDGRYAFWTYVPEGSGQPTRLLARIDGERTIQLDANAGGTGPSGNGVYWGAAADGTAVLFVGENPLLAGASPNDLYHYDVPSETLTDLTAGLGEAAQVQGVLGASNDASYVYFVALGNLTGSESSPTGGVAQPGKPNLYMWHSGKGLRFIGTLQGPDSFDWSLESRGRTARVSPDGRHLAFLSTATKTLSGYDNRISGGADCHVTPSPLCPEAYLFDAGADTLTCVSCNPSGSRPDGPTFLPGWSNPFEGPRYLSADGSRLFFETFDALTPGDSNSRRDVYEAEKPGSGSCAEGSSNYVPSSGSCLFLISSGSSSDESYLLDASSSGGDVFFATRSQLVGADHDENYDVYDSRVEGGFPEPLTPEPCEGEGCRPPVTVPPQGTNPGTASFSGPGNAPQAKKKRKTHKKKNRHHHGRHGK